MFNIDLVLNVFLIFKYIMVNNNVEFIINVNKMCLQK